MAGRLCYTTGGDGKVSDNSRIHLRKAKRRLAANGKREGKEFRRQKALIPS
jgi:hypothetical protein